MQKTIKFISADEAVKYVKSGDHIHLSSVASAPKVLIDALCRRGDAGELRDVRIHHLHTEGEAPYTDAKYEGIFFHQAFFVGANVRKGVQADDIQCFFFCGGDMEDHIAAQGQYDQHAQNQTPVVCKNVFQFFLQGLAFELLELVSDCFFGCHDVLSFLSYAWDSGGMKKEKVQSAKKWLLTKFTRIVK